MLYNLIIILTGASTLVAIATIALTIIRLRSLSFRSQPGHIYSFDGRATRPHLIQVSDQTFVKGVFLRTQPGSYMVSQLVLDLSDEGFEYANRKRKNKQEHSATEMQPSEEE